MNLNEFLEKTKKTFSDTFDLAKSKDELAYANALFGESSPYRYNTMHEAARAFDQYINFFNNNDYPELRPRIAMAFYCHLWEASGYWLILKNVLCIINGDDYKTYPFSDLIKKHKTTGEDIMPNATATIKSIVGLAHALDNKNLVSAFIEAYDADIRNGFSHADYIVLEKGISLQNRHGKERVILKDNFNLIITRGVYFCKSMHDVVYEKMRDYSTEKHIIRNEGKDSGDWYIYFDENTGKFYVGNTSVSDPNIRKKFIG